MSRWPWFFDPAALPQRDLRQLLNMKTLRKTPKTVVYQYDAKNITRIMMSPKLVSTLEEVRVGPS